jgi:hypothetical protein
MSIYDLVDKHEQLVKNSLEWNSSLPFVVSSSFLLSQDFPSLFGAKFKEDDLFELVSPTGLLGTSVPINSLHMATLKHQRRGGQSLRQLFTSWRLVWDILSVQTVSPTKSTTA